MGANRTAHRLTNIDAGGREGGIHRSPPMILKRPQRPCREREMKCECRAVSFQRARVSDRRKPNRIPKKTFSYLTILTTKARSVGGVHVVRRSVRPRGRRDRQTLHKHFSSKVDSQWLLCLVRLNTEISVKIFEFPIWFFGDCCVSRDLVSQRRARGEKLPE